jgi:ABC-type uncharacterized transport system permease subunit
VLLNRNKPKKLAKDGKGVGMSSFNRNEMFRCVWKNKSECKISHSLGFMFVRPLVNYCLTDFDTTWYSRPTLNFVEPFLPSFSFLRLNNTLFKSLNYVLLINYTFSVLHHILMTQYLYYTIITCEFHSLQFILKPALLKGLNSLPFEVTSLMRQKCLL